MAHMIDETTGKAAIAYAGQTPWHGLGQALTAGASIETWTVEAGLNWSVQRSPVYFQREADTEADASLTIFKGRDVLHRSDTGAPLGVVSDDYKVVQPAEIMNFFEKLVQIGGFQMETAGALSDGKRIWALAKVNDGAPIIGHDIVRPYLLLTTSYDGTLATTAKLTTIRVVCNNTITASLYENGTEGRAVSSIVKVPHNATFNAESVRKDMGIFADSFDKWVIQTRLLAEQEIDLDTAGKMTANLISAIQAAPKEGKVVDVTKSKGYARVMELFDGAAIGSDLTEGHTKWQWVNGVSQWVDHERGRTDDSRLNSAWFGAGEKIKNHAYAIAMAHAA